MIPPTSPLEAEIERCRDSIRRVIIDTVTGGDRSSVPDRTLVLLATLADELFQATAAANILCGDEKGSEFLDILLEEWPQIVWDRTTQLRHEVDQMEGADGQRGA